MRNQRKQESAREKNKKNSARFLANERYSYHFWEAERPPPSQIISFFEPKEKGAKIAHSPTPLIRVGNRPETERK